MPDYYLGDLRTGNFTTRIPGDMVTEGPWDDRIFVTPTISLAVDLGEKSIRDLGMRNVATPAKAFLAVVDGEHVLAGPVWARSWQGDDRILSMHAAGLESYYDHRHILPILAATLPLWQWTVPDPEDEDAAMPNPALTTAFSGVSFGTIAKRLVQQAHEWAGGELPVVLPPDEPGAHEAAYLAAEFKTVGSALRDITDREDGPEHRFRARVRPDGRGIEWILQIGNPVIAGAREHLWDLSLPRSVVYGLNIDEDASGIASLAWATGGRESDRFLVSRQSDPTLLDAGFPLLETVDTSHSSAERQSTLDAHARGNLSTRPFETWSIVAKAHPVDKHGYPAGPQLGEFAMGDYATIVVPPWDEDKGVGDPYLLEGGKFRHRIVGLRGDAGDLVTIQLQRRTE